jgi:hypothetical protein
MFSLTLSVCLPVYLPVGLSVWISIYLSLAHSLTLSLTNPLDGARMANATSMLNRSEAGANGEGNATQESEMYYHTTFSPGSNSF